MDVKKKEMDLLSNSIAAYAHIKGKRPEQPSVIGRFTAAVKEVIHRQYLSWRTVFYYSVIVMSVIVMHLQIVSNINIKSNILEVLNRLSRWQYELIYRIERCCLRPKKK